MASSLTPELQSIVDSYSNTFECHDRLHSEFVTQVHSRPYLMKHKNYGDHSIYGEVSFHYLWDLLVQNCPDDFRFLEIGVFKGQVISLIGLLAGLYKKRAFIVGISPFDGTGDKYSTYNRNLDYESIARKTWSNFLPEGDISLQLVKGSSTDIQKISDIAVTYPYDIIYIDGCHDYDVVVKDILNYAPMVKDGGFLVMDDAATDRATHNWPGHADVGRAVVQFLDTNPQFQFLLAIGHIKLYRRIK